MTHVKELCKQLYQQAVIFIVINSDSLRETGSLCERCYHMLSHARLGALIHYKRNIQIKILNSRVNYAVSESNIFIPVA